MKDQGPLLSECEDAAFLRNAVDALWQIIDDIDTTGDMAKNNDVWFRERVEHLQKKRWKTGVTTDGYKLFIDTSRAVTP